MRAGSVAGLRRKAVRLIAYLDGAALRDDPKGPLFRTIGRGTGKLTRTVLPQANAHAMIGRCAASAGIVTKLGNHSFRATGPTAYLKNGGTLEKAAVPSTPDKPPTSCRTWHCRGARRRTQQGARADRQCGRLVGSGVVSAPTASMMARPARAARSASSSCASG
jgi:hypothetical protein